MVNNFVSYRRIAPQFATKSVLSQFFQATKIMMFHVAMGLVQFCCDLRQRVTLNEEKPQCLLLIVGEAAESVFQEGISQQCIITILLPFDTVPTIAQFVFYVRKIHTRVEVARIQITTTGK